MTRILLAEDDSQQRKHLALVLRAAGHEVDEASGGNPAWAQWQVVHHRLVVVDWIMPDGDGLSLVRRVRAAVDWQPYTYLLLITNLSKKKEIVIGLEAGADDYVTKPADAGELKARIRVGERVLRLETSLREIVTRLDYLATYDALTGLHNRRALLDLIAAEWRRAMRLEQPLSLVMGDIDFFKHINDEYGHAAGDEALRVVAGVLRQQKRPYDLVGRWGGEEFLLALPDTHGLEAEQAANRLRLAIAEAACVLPDGRQVPLRMSLGVACVWPTAGPCLDDVIQRADAVLYQAKASGRNCVCVADYGVSLCPV